MELIARHLLEIYNQYPDFTTEVLVASVRHPIHVRAGGRSSAPMSPPSRPIAAAEVFAHPLTDKGLAAFLEDWRQDRAVHLSDPE